MKGVEGFREFREMSRQIAGEDEHVKFRGFHGVNEMRDECLIPRCHVRVQVRDNSYLHTVSQRLVFSAAGERILLNSNSTSWVLSQ